MSGQHAPSAMSGQHAPSCPYSPWMFIVFPRQDDIDSGINTVDFTLHSYWMSQWWWRG